MSRPRATTQANQMTPTPIVKRSRFRSATDDPPRLLDTPPPNMSDRPPPRPLWRSTSRIMIALVRTSRMVKARITSGSLRHVRREPVSASQHGHVVETADPAELVDLQAGAPDEASVDVRLLHDPADVRGLDRPAVEDPQAVGRTVAVHLADALADRRADLLRVVRGRHLARADGPDGLVGDHEARDLLGGEPVERAVELREREGHVLAGLAYVETLPDAHDRGHPGVERLVGLRVDQLVGLVVVHPALAVPDDDVGAAQLGQHGRGDLAGVGAVVVDGDVLGAVADRQPVAVDQRLHRAQVGERRHHDDLDLAEVVALVRQRPGELLDRHHRFLVVEVHLPVARHQRRAVRLLGHGQPLSSTAMPGSSLPSRNSSDAPPPVEMWPNAASSKPSWRTAAAESPPPTTDRPSISVSACATARVPPAKASVSNTPIGPFQKTVLASASAAAKAAADSGPMSSPRASAGISEAGTTDGCGSRSPDGNAVSTTTSVGSRISTPRSAASLR